MINAILGALLPPDPRKLGRVPPGSLVLHRVREGELKPEAPEPAESWAGNVIEWGNGRWSKPTRVFSDF